MKNTWLACCLGVGMLVACGGGSAAVAPPDTNGFEIDPADQMVIDDAADNGFGAEGSYGYDATAGTLTITITASTFGCGIEPGVLVAKVVELTPTRMVWEFEDDNGRVEWTRVDAGTDGVVGVWKTTDPDLFAVFTADGGAQIFGKEAPCNGGDRPRNEESCVEMGLFGASITIDGDLSDWDAVGGSATITDANGDNVGTDPGADLRALKVEYTGTTLYVLMQLHSAPSLNFQNRQPPNSGVYRLTVKGTNGLSVVERVAYDPDTSSWYTVGDASQVTAAVGDEGIEFAVDVSAHTGEGFTSIDLIMVEPMDCGQGTCQTLDYTDCGYFDVPQ